MKKLLLVLSVCGLAHAAGVQKIDPISLLDRVKGILLTHAERPTFDEWYDTENAKYKNKGSQADYETLTDLQRNAETEEMIAFLAALLADYDQIIDQRTKEEFVDLAIRVGKQLVSAPSQVKFFPKPQLIPINRDIEALRKLGAAKTAAMLVTLVPGAQPSAGAAVPQAPQPVQTPKSPRLPAPSKKAEAEQKERKAVSEEQRKKATIELLNILKYVECWRSKKYILSAGELEKIKAAIDAGADVNSVSDKMSLWSYLHIRKANKGPRVIELKFYGQFTPLMLASYRNEYAVVKLLLDAGAKVNTKETTNYQDSALSLALIGAKACGIPQEKTLRTIQVLCQHNADPNVATKNGDTPLYIAIQARLSLAIIRALIECGGDPELQNDAGINIHKRLEELEKIDAEDKRYAESIREILEKVKREIFQAARTPVGEEYSAVGTPEFPIPKEKGIRPLIAEYLVGKEPEPEQKRKGAAPRVVSEAEEMAEVD